MIYLGFVERQSVWHFGMDKAWRDRTVVGWILHQWLCTWNEIKTNKTVWVESNLMEFIWHLEGRAAAVIKINSLLSHRKKPILFLTYVKVCHLEHFLIGDLYENKMAGGNVNEPQTEENSRGCMEQSPLVSPRFTIILVKSTHHWQQSMIYPKFWVSNYRVTSKFTLRLRFESPPSKWKSVQ